MSLKGTTLLFIDDDENILLRFSNLFTKAEITVYTAMTMIEAEAIIRQHGEALDLIISDYHLEDASAVTLYLELEEKHPNACNIPLIMFTSVEGSYVKNYMPKSANLLAVINKDVDVKPLIVEVKKVLDAL